MAEQSAHLPGRSTADACESAVRREIERVQGHGTLAKSCLRVTGLSLQQLQQAASDREGFRNIVENLDMWASTEKYAITLPNLAREVRVVDSFKFKKRLGRRNNASIRKHHIENTTY